MKRTTFAAIQVLYLLLFGAVVDVVGRGIAQQRLTPRFHTLENLQGNWVQEISTSSVFGIFTLAACLVVFPFAVTVVFHSVKVPKWLALVEFGFLAVAAVLLLAAQTRDASSQFLGRV